MSSVYRGKKADADLAILFGHSGDLEIEFIEWRGGESPHREFIESGREGMHHLRFRVDDMDAKIAEAESQGYRPIWQKRFAEGLAAVYLERDGDPVILRGRIDRIDHVQVVRPSLSPIFPGMCTGVGRYVLKLPVGFRPVGVMRVQRFCVIGAFITEHGAKFLCKSG